MLSLMRRKAGSWIIKVILSVIVIVFVFWGVGSYRNRRTTQVADINGTIITYDAYRQAYQRVLEQYRRIYGDRLNDDMLQLLHLNEMALDQMVQRILMLQEARRLGLHTTPQEVADAIHQIPAFQRDGRFDFNLYTSLLARNNISVEEFEKDQEDAIVIQRLRAVVLDGVTVSEADARQWYDWQNTQVALTYLMFSPERYTDIAPTDEQIAAYYEQHQNEYLTQPRVKVSYLFFDPRAFEAQVTVSDEEINRYYNEHVNEFYSEKTVQARHILFKLESDADDKTIAAQQQKAMTVYELAKNGRDFSDLAKQYSEGPSRSNGGDLGTFSRGSMVKPFADKAFTMAAGEISEPVRTRFGWHIIKVEKVNPAATQSLKDAAQGIKKKLLSRKSRELALEKAENVYDTFFDGDQLSMVDANNLVSKGTTDFFSSQNPPTGVADAREFAEAALPLEKMEISTITETESGYYLLQVIDRIDPAVPPLEDVVQRVRSDVIDSMQKERAETDAQAALEQLKKESTLSDVATAYGLDVQQTGLFSRNSPIADLGSEPEITRLAFTLSPEAPLAQQVVQVKHGWVVFALKERKAPDESGFADEKENIIARLIDMEKQTAIEAWLDDLKSHGTVDINYDLIK